MPKTRSFAEVHAELADEHREVMSLIAHIESGPPAEQLADLLKSLHDLLVNHFAHEQFPGGLYECMGANNPQHHDTLKVLVRDHCEILSGARGLVERARAGEPGADPGLGQAIAELVARLREHETREHELARTIEQARPELAHESRPGG